MMSFEIIREIFIKPLLLTTGLATILSPGVIFLYKKFGWLDDPKKNSHEKVVHKYPVPRGGGLVVGLSLLIGILVFLGIDKHSVGILLGVLILLITGVVDDVKDLNPYLRIFLGLLAALMVVAAGIGIAFITNPFSDGVINLSQPQLGFYLFGKLRTLWVLADIFALVWILWCMNMVNWSKGVDGQLPGMVVIAASAIALLSFKFTEDITQWEVAKLAGLLAGAYLGFLPFNFYPQKMMPGYGAGSIAGYLLAVLSVLSGAKVATLIIVLGIPMIDALYVMVRRIKMGKSPVWGDRSHFHHKLMDLKWGKRRIAIFYWLITMLLGVVALQLNARQKVFTIVLLGLLFGSVLLWINYFIISSRRQDLGSG